MSDRTSQILQNRPGSQDEGKPIGRKAARALLSWTRDHAVAFHTALGALITAALLLATASLWMLGALTEGVLEGETLQFDERALLWLHGHSSPGLTEAALGITALGSGYVAITIGLVVGAMLWLLRRPTYAVLLWAGIAGGAVLSTVLKAVFDRPRPDLFEAAVVHGSSAYPSGHTTVGTVMLVLLAFIVHRLAGPGRVSATAATVAAVLILLIGITRIYLGAHYPTDVLAGLAVGFIWAVACASAVEVLHGARSSGGRWTMPLRTEKGNFRPDIPLEDPAPDCARRTGKN